jgi:hypothetical protein
MRFEIMSSSRETAPPWIGSAQEGRRQRWSKVLTAARHAKAVHDSAAVRYEICDNPATDDQAGHS